MVVDFTGVRVGEPVRRGPLAVFPLFAEASSPVDYLLADEAIGASSLVVTEVGEAGSVPELRVENAGDRRVLFLEGEQLVGAKQNRVLNTSILVPAHATTRLPVSCVEQGRWSYRSRTFGSSGSHSHAKLRHALKATVTRSLRSGRGHSSDQGAVWDEVARQQESMGVASLTGAMDDTFAHYEATLAESRAALAYIPGATGLAVALGPAVVAVDLFDQPETCRKVWDRLLSGALMESLEPGQGEGQATVADVEGLLSRSSRARWEEAPAVGEGTEYRAEIDRGHGSALLLGATPVHRSVVVER